ncbi:MAG: hypothetical protein IKK10_00810 [Clostridia bacterium]|nr:hypothetical protein [Clostridia bacterium]
MISGVKHINSHPFFFLKKRYCLKCNTKLNVIKDSKIVNSNSPEAPNYDFSMGDTFLSGDVKFIYKMLKCPNCKTRFSADEIIKAKSRR